MNLRALLLLTGLLISLTGYSQQLSIDTLTYREFSRKVLHLGYQQNHNLAIEYMEKGRSLYPEKEHEILANLVMNYLMLNDEENALSAFRYAIVNNMFLGFDPDWVIFDSLAYTAEFDSLLQIDRKKKLEKQASSEVKLLVELPEDYRQDTLFPLFIVLHNWGGTAEEFKEVWTSDRLKNGFVVAYIQSSQVADMGGYCWDDKELALQEIVNSYNKLIKEYAVDTTRALIGGFSQGGEMAIYCLFEQAIPLKGFLTVAPGKPVNFTDENILRAKGKKQKGIIYTGMYDPNTNIHANMRSKFLELGFLYKFSPRKTIGHEMPPTGFDEYLDKNVKFLGVK